ncbi:hypothetical protein FOZ60_000180 [Perkinsus olseni]|uniref:Uncharacterized protein n=1 Tax=Perkinsus olseni TaxID=32597 RepID=A0A7J6PLP3_PEROL|nr:hypothetical protein FOZ60_000180 [Perkinsus olseni]
MSLGAPADIEERGSLIRGIPLRSITSRWTLFRGSEGSDETYALSKPVEELDMFLSHSWSGSPLWKHLTLISILYVKTGYIAMLATVIPLSVGSIFPASPSESCVSRRTDPGSDRFCTRHLLRSSRAQSK